MIGFLGEWLYAVWEILALSGPWLLVGFLIAGVIRVALPERLVYRHLGKDNWRSVLTAAIAGIPIPLCSCSVLPTAISLRKSGASKGATTSFLISTPETGVDSIGITWALMDPVMTIVRPVAALVTALGSGLLVNVLARLGLLSESREGDGESSGDTPEDHAHDHGHAHGHDHSHDHPEDESGPVGVRALRYAFGPLLDDLTPWFLFGLVLSGLIAVLVPDGFFASTWNSGWISMLAMLAIGVPMYVCATASTPIAAALVAKGLDPGAALVFLLVGPATNIATIAVVRGFLGGRVLASYLVSIVVISLACGVLLEPLYATLGLDAVARMGSVTQEGLGPLDVTGGVVMLALLLVSARRLGLAPVWLRTTSRILGRIGIDTTARSTRFAGVVAVLLIGLSASIDVVRVGETGFLTRFGRVVREQHEPGMMLHLPYPIDRFEAVRTAEVRGVGVGIDESAGQLRRASRMTEVTTGDETLLLVPYAVHYVIADAYRHRFGVVDPEKIVVDFSSTALQRAVSRLTTDEVLVGERRTLEGDVARMLAEELRSVDLGVEVVGLQIGSIHAPDMIHEAFRDVASALEDKERFEHEGEAYRVATLTVARGTAAELVQAAQAAAVAETSDAQGRAEAFQALLEAYAEAPEATLMKLRLDALQSSLEDATVVFKLGEDVEVVNLPPFATDDAR